MSEYKKRQMVIEQANKMALAHSKNYTWSGYTKLVDFCTDNDIEYFDYQDEEGNNGFYIEDERYMFID